MMKAQAEKEEEERGEKKRAKKEKKKREREREEKKEQAEKRKRVEAEEEERREKKKRKREKKEVKDSEEAEFEYFKADAKVSRASIAAENLVKATENLSDVRRTIFDLFAKLLTKSCNKEQARTVALHLEGALDAHINSDLDIKGYTKKANMLLYNLEQNQVRWLPTSLHLTKNTYTHLTVYPSPPSDSARPGDRHGDPARGGGVHGCRGAGLSAAESEAGEAPSRAAGWPALRLVGGEHFHHPQGPGIQLSGAH